MSTVILFVILLLLISLFALLFVCYQQQQRGREMRLAQEAAAATAAASANHRAAAIIFSSPVGHYPDATNLDQQRYPPQLRLASARAGHQQQQQLQPAEPASFARFYNKKSPTPRVIIDNLPVVEFQAARLRRPAPAATTTAAAAARASADDAAPAKDAGSAGDDDDDDAPQCVICCCAYQAGELVKLLPCLHSMHAECIDLWLERDHTCPICQADVVLAAGLSMRDWSSHPLESNNILLGGDHSPAPAAGPAAAPAVPAAAAGAGCDVPPALPVSSSSSYAGNAADAPTWTASSRRSPPRPVRVPHAAAALYAVQPSHGGSNSLAAGLPGS